MEDQHLSAVPNCLFGIFAVTFKHKDNLTFTSISGRRLLRPQPEDADRDPVISSIYKMWHDNRVSYTSIEIIIEAIRERVQNKILKEIEINGKTIEFKFLGC
jgi:hypothetical protein